ncbi:MAG TPA: AAA family ATPase [Verrucomicrobiota bacterium]|nr:AAA family ATPase [Verrucomicrobiota bacterium]
MTEASLPHVDIRSVSELLKSPDGDDQAWLVENLIREGDQVVLAGPPKSGKSFLAFQLAMAVVQGVNHEGNAWFLKPEFALPNVSPRRVLFFSLEMGAGVMRSRLLPWKDVKSPKGRATEEISDLKFIFSVGGRSTLNLEHQDDAVFKAVQAVVEKHRPHLVIFDTFVRVHGLNENENVEMAALMQNLQDICTLPDEAKPGTTRRVTHVIVHHLRKPGKEFWSNASVIDAVRGAGSIIGAADLILGMGVTREGQRKLEFCCRHLPEREPLLLEFDEVADAQVEQSNQPRNTVVVFREFKAPPKPPGTTLNTPKLHKNTQLAIDEVGRILTEEFKDYGAHPKVTVGQILDKLPADKTLSPEALCKNAKAVMAEDWFYVGGFSGKSRRNYWERKNPHTPKEKNSPE